MSFPTNPSDSNIIPSHTPSISNKHNQNNKLETIDEKIQDINEENNEDDEFDDNGDLDEITEEEEKEDKNEDNKKEKKNTDESQKLNVQSQPGQGKLERFFIYLRSGFIWRPVPTITSTVLCLEITGAIFLIIGIIIFIFSKTIKEIEIRYDNNENCQIGTKCDINITINKTMNKEIFVYYRLKHFYQNHRRYMKSKSLSQLKGKIMTENDIKDDCDPIKLNKDLYEGVKSIDGKELDPDGVAHPCGLIAKSFFNDTYELRKIGENDSIKITSEKIAWSKDKKKYKNSENYTSHQWLNVEDERFMVWMREAALPDFRKPWGRIERDLYKGNYILSITNNYPVKSFKGKKYFILSTVNALGGRNYFLATLYMVIGGFSILSGIMFWIGYKSYNEIYNAKSTKIE